MSPKEKLEALIANGIIIIQDKKEQKNQLAISLANRFVPTTVKQLVKESTPCVTSPHDSSVRYVKWHFNQRLSFTAVVDVETQQLNFCWCDINGGNGCRKDVTNYIEDEFAVLFANFKDSLDL